MFKVRATVVGFMGDEEKYPCHFQHKIGDEFIYDGERYTGRICPGFSAALIPRMMNFFAAGPRAVRNTTTLSGTLPSAAETRQGRSMTASASATFWKRRWNLPATSPLEPKHAFDWPPVNKRTVFLDNSIVICGDTRTSRPWRRSRPSIWRIRATPSHTSAEKCPY